MQPQPLPARSRPRQAIDFAPGIAGPSGAKLVSYEWQWREGEKSHPTEGLIPARVSDWDRAASSGDTGREIVHQFGVKLPDGTHRTVSSESVSKLLGFVAGTAAPIKSTTSTLKRIAAAHMELAALEPALAESERILAEAQKLATPFPSSGHSLPNLPHRANAVWVQYGEAPPATYWLSALKQEQAKDNAHQEAKINWFTWKAEQMGAMPALAQFSARSRVTDLKNRIAVAEAKLAMATSQRLTSRAAETPSGVPSQPACQNAAAQPAS